MIVKIALLCLLPCSLLSKLVELHSLSSQLGSQGNKSTSDAPLPHCCPSVVSEQKDESPMNPRYWTDKMKYSNIDEEVVLGKQIGRGGFGAAFEVFDKILQKNCVVKKVFKKLKPNGSTNYLTLKRELSILKHLPQHKNICQYYRHFETDDAVWIVLEHCGTHSIRDYVWRKPTTEEPELRYFMQQVVEGHVELHKVGIYHMDVKRKREKRSCWVLYL